MAGVPRDQIIVACACGARLRVPATAVGKKTKCPKCASLITIKAAAPQAAPRPAPKPAPSAEAGDGLLDDLAKFEQTAAASAAQPAVGGGAGVACPNCGLALPPNARLCIACGFDLTARRVRKAVSASSVGKPSKAAAFAKSAGGFALGTGLSALGALIGAGI